jgi:hypothetical protein
MVVGVRVRGENAARLLSWGTSTERSDVSSESVPPQPAEGGGGDGGVEYGEHVYHTEDDNADVLAGLGLRLTIFVAAVRHRLAFDLRDVPLP